MLRQQASLAVSAPLKLNSLGVTAMKFTDHVELSDWKDQCLLTVRDIELHDFFDDFFSDHGIKTMAVRPPGEPRKYQLLFPSAVSRATVLRLLAQVGSDEIDRIVRINGSASRIESGT